jgi:hypothetical protein
MEHLIDLTEFDDEGRAKADRVAHGANDEAVVQRLRVERAADLQRGIEGGLVAGFATSSTPNIRPSPPRQALLDRITSTLPLLAPIKPSQSDTAPKTGTYVSKGTSFRNLSRTFAVMREILLS